VLKEIEAVRQAGRVGSSLQAEVTISTPEPAYSALASLGDDLRFVTITLCGRCVANLHGAGEPRSHA
jgi:isoleucyl-tRNA synthetase